MSALPYSSTRISGTHSSNPDLLPRERDELLRAGVPAKSLESPTPIRAAYVVWTAPDRFAFSQHEPLHTRPERAFVFLVEDQAGPIDVIAWQAQVERLGSWRRAAWALGQDRAYNARLDGHEGLSVWRSPLDWLRANRRGIVLVQPRLAAHFLDDAGPLIAMDFEHGQELRQALQRPGPRILIPAQARRAA